MPSNSSTVVMQENTYKEGNKIHLIKIPKFGDNYLLVQEDYPFLKLDLKENNLFLQYSLKDINDCN